jgi:hypothetical protein
VNFWNLVIWILVMDGESDEGIGVGEEMKLEMWFVPTVHHD